MHVQEYVETYIGLINDVLARAQPDYDPKCSRSLFLLMQEEQIIEQEYYAYHSEHGEPPNRAFMMEQVIRFGVNRADFFNENHREVSDEEFVQAHLESVNDGSILVKSQFEPEDYAFILKRETHLAKQAFANASQQELGYEELNVVRSKKKQDWLLAQLKIQFEQTCDSFYLGLRRL